MTTSPVYFIVNELNLLRIIWRAMTGSLSCVICIRSIFTGRSSSYLQKIVQYLRNTSQLTILETDRPEFVIYPFFGDLVRETNVFAESEAWLEKQFSFDKSAERFGDYATAYRHVCSNAAFDRFQTAYLIVAIIRSDLNAQIMGMDAFDIDYVNFRFPECHVAPPPPTPLVLIVNAMGFLWALLFTLMSICTRVRFNQECEMSFRLASDFIENPTNMILWEEVSDTQQDVLVVFRSPSDRESYKNHIGGRPFTTSTDGRFSLTDAFYSAQRSLLDFIMNFSHTINLPTDFFRRLVALPYRRIMYRGLFNKYHCDSFWGRDDYNPEHALRSIELRRRGSTSIGIMHGIPSIASVIHQIRHIDFDIYYVAGCYQAETYYKKRWPSHMKVTPIGSFGLTRSEFNRLSETKVRKNGIACFLSPHFLHRKILKTLQEIAITFPNRILYINTKNKGVVSPDIDTAQSRFDKDIAAFIATSPDNIIFYTGRSYELFERCDTVLSPGSTLNAEAIQFGLNSFVFDYEPERWKALDYRDFPDACVSSGAELIKRLSEIESGDWRFPREKWSDFIDMSGSVPWDTIRRDMRLLRKPSLPT